MNQEFAYMGEFLKDYKPPLINLNATINYLTTKKVVFYPSAIITREVQFPDVSFYQRQIDFEIMKTKTKAIIIRAGQGSWVDEQFERNYAEAKRTRLLVGIYWFYDDRVSPGKQADLLISLLRGKKIDLEVFIDWEKTYGGAYKGLQNVVAMMQLVEKAGLNIKDVGLYTGYYWFRSNSNSVTNANQYNYLKNKPLWLAWYTSNPANVLIPAPWASLTHWQFGTPVVYWGQQTSELDMNFFNGSVQEFNQRYTGAVMPEDKYFKVTTSALNIRYSPTWTTNNDIGDLVIEDIIHSIETAIDNSVSPAATWKQFDKVWKNGKWNTLPLAGQTASPTGQYWAAEKSSSVWMTETSNPEPPTLTLKHTIKVYNDGSIDVDGNYIP